MLGSFGVTGDLALQQVPTYPCQFLSFKKRKYNLNNRRVQFSVHGAVSDFEWLKTGQFANTTGI